MGSEHMTFCKMHGALVATCVGCVADRTRADAVAAARRDALEMMMRVLDGAFVPAHTYGSENAEIYRAHDAGQYAAINKVRSAIRALLATPTTEGEKKP